MLPAVASGTQNNIAGIDLNTFISSPQIYICYTMRPKGASTSAFVRFHMYREMSGKKSGATTEHRTSMILRRNDEGVSKREWDIDYSILSKVLKYNAWEVCKLYVLYPLEGFKIQLLRGCKYYIYCVLSKVLHLFTFQMPGRL